MAMSQTLLEASSALQPLRGCGMTEYQWISIALIIVGTALLGYHWKPEQIKQSIKRT